MLQARIVEGPAQDSHDWIPAFCSKADVLPQRPDGVARHVTSSSQSLCGPSSKPCSNCLKSYNKNSILADLMNATETLLGLSNMLFIVTIKIFDPETLYLASSPYSPNGTARLSYPVGTASPFALARAATCSQYSSSSAGVTRILPESSAV